eukprot:scaffold37451_cov37-Phaeocystis_antarctica.AAC.1
MLQLVNLARPPLMRMPPPLPSTPWPPVIFNPINSSCRSGCMPGGTSMTRSETSLHSLYPCAYWVPSNKPNGQLELPRRTTVPATSASRTTLRFSTSVLPTV